MNYLKYNSNNATEYYKAYILEAYNFQYFQKGVNMFNAKIRKKMEIQDQLLSDIMNAGEDDIDQALFEKIENEVIKDYKNNLFKWDESLVDL